MLVLDITMYDHFTSLYLTLLLLSALDIALHVVADLEVFEGANSFSIHTFFRGQALK